MTNIYRICNNPNCTQTCSVKDTDFTDTSTGVLECYISIAISTQTVEKSKEEKKREASLEMRNVQVTKSYDRKHKMPVIFPKPRYKEHYRNCSR